MSQLVYFGTSWSIIGQNQEWSMWFVTRSAGKNHIRMLIGISVDKLWMMFRDFMTNILGTREIQETLEVVLGRNPHISPTVNEAAECMDGYSKVLVNLQGNNTTFILYLKSFLFPRILHRCYFWRTNPMAPIYHATNATV